MNIATKSALLALACAGLSPARAATINIQISQGVNQATNFASFDGSVSNGLVWGVIISTADTQFSVIRSQFQLSTSLDGTLIPGTDDYVIMSPVLTAQGTNLDAANPGKINILNSIQMNVPATNAIVTGNQFAIIWFDTTITSPTQSTGGGGQYYGLITNAAWTIPAAGSTQNISARFALSPDPVKRADDFWIPPEPSTAMLAMLGALGLLRRRR